ncbi:hypothetical protein CONCODRAFT_14238, partial [Conidiobolus coronatus NRRL 28638]
QLICPKANSKCNSIGKLTLNTINNNLALKCSNKHCHANIKNSDALALYSKAGFPINFEPFNLLEDPKLIHPNPAFNSLSYLIKPILRNKLEGGPYYDLAGFINPESLNLTTSSTNKRAPTSGFNTPSDNEDNLTSSHLNSISNKKFIQSNDMDLDDDLASCNTSLKAKNDFLTKELEEIKEINKKLRNEMHDLNHRLMEHLIKIQHQHDNYPTIQQASYPSNSSPPTIFHSKTPLNKSLYSEVLKDMNFVFNSEEEATNNQAYASLKFLNTPSNFKTKSLTAPKKVYLKGLKRNPIGQIRKAFRHLNFTISKILNISFVGYNTTELLIDESYVEEFQGIINSKMSKLNWAIIPNFNPIKSANPKATIEDHKKCKEIFLRRISGIIYNTPVLDVKEYYSNELEKLGLTPSPPQNESPSTSTSNDLTTNNYSNIQNEFSPEMIASIEFLSGKKITSTLSNNSDQMDIDNEETISQTLDINQSNYWNCCGISSISLEQYLAEFIPSIDFDILFLAETWFQDLPQFISHPNYICHSTITPRICIANNHYTRHTSGIYCLAHTSLKPYILSYHTTPYSITIIFQPPNPISIPNNLNFNAKPTMPTMPIKPTIPTNPINTNINSFNSLPSTSYFTSYSNSNSIPNLALNTTSPSASLLNSTPYIFKPITIQAIYIPPSLSLQDTSKFITPPYPIDVLIGDVGYSGHHI